MTTRDRILTCALEELQTRGLAELSLRAVGQKVGLTPMAIYRHFADKDDLMQALGEHALSLWQARVEMVDAASPDWFKAVAVAFIDFALDSPSLFDAAFILKTRAERIYPEDFAAGRSPVIAAFSRWLSEGQAQGRVRTAEPLELAMGTWGVLQGLIGLHRSGRFNMTRPEFTALCLRSAQRLYDKDMI